MLSVRALGLVPLTLVCCWSACGPSSGPAGGPGSGGGSDFLPGGGSGGSHTGGIHAGGGAGPEGGEGSGAPSGNDVFRFGINLGHPNPEFDDAEMSDLGARVGVRSIRLKYPEYHFANWGQSIEVSDAEHYASLGMENHVAFLIGMTEAHSTAPAGSADWERDYYIPKNLYEPIFLEDGSVNPDNFYAKYLEQTFLTYRDYVKYWEIFNEPDWVADWQVTQTWDTEPPSSQDLVRFHGSIFDYVRMLRIATVVRDKAAPGTLVMTGGLGYPSFLSAILRYTDNPDGGKVTDAYPRPGGAYFDVLSIHHYPHLVEDGPSDLALASLEASRDNFLAELERAGESKPFMVTESGAPHEVIAGDASGPEYARNYLQKSMVWAKAEGFLGIDWYTLSDGSDAQDAFGRMGLYEDISNLAAPGDARPTNTGMAYLTTSRVLTGTAFDPERTAALSLESGVRGYVFASSSKLVEVLWAESGDSEDASTQVALPMNGTVSIYRWDAQEAPSETKVAAGALDIEVTSSPVFVVLEK